ncbi:MAG: thioredoxin domain-containing protein [Candidatus Pacebacteria bacterium]|nr:thioredoxin domain-containing protein [Candidatus Paceibacterota bacterium]
MEEKRNKFLIPAALIIAIILITWGVFSSRDKSETANNFTNAANSAETTKKQEEIQISVKENDHILGNPDALLILISFSDFECPWCKQFHQTMKRIMAEYGKSGQVAWIFRPLSSQNESSQEKVKGAVCVAQLGGNAQYWEYSDKLFEVITSENSVDTNQLSEIAVKIGLDKNDFANCLSADSTAKLIKDIFQSGIDSGILGTPQDPGGTPYTLAITKSGKVFPINGAQPYDLVKTMIDLILAEEKNK